MSNKLGIIEGIDYFDTAFFGIHRNQASYMDPMQRLVLERTFEALMDAGKLRSAAKLRLLNYSHLRGKSARHQGQEDRSVHGLVDRRERQPLLRVHSERFRRDRPFQGHDGQSNFVLVELEGYREGKRCVFNVKCVSVLGPSCAYDSNWNGGMEVLTLAVDAVKQGIVESAIIAAANLALNSEISWLYNDMGLLSPDGSVRAFDADGE